MNILNLNEYVDAIRHSYWVHTEFNFTSDIQDFKVHLNEKERSAVTKSDVGNFSD
jgi:ribonucleoside-diphosphate reductase beta chain